MEKILFISTAFLKSGLENSGSSCALSTFEDPAPLNRRQNSLKYLRLYAPFRVAACLPSSMTNSS